MMAGWLAMQHMHFQKSEADPWTLVSVFFPSDRNEEHKKSRSRQLSWSSGSRWQWKIIVIATTYRQATLFPGACVSRYLGGVWTCFGPVPFGEPGSRANWTVCVCCVVPDPPGLWSASQKDSSKSIDQLQAGPLGVDETNVLLNLATFYFSTDWGRDSSQGDCIVISVLPNGGLMLAVKHV